VSDPGAKLARMANQIGSFFASEPDHALALEGIAWHLRQSLAAAGDLHAFVVDQSLEPFAGPFIDLPRVRQ
jgi:hypothetical protein